MSIDTWSKLMQVLEDEVKQGLRQVAIDVKSIIRDYIDKEVYQSYTPTDYQRTGELLESLDVSDVQKVGNVYEVTIFFNPDLINMKASGGGWNQHMSVDGSDTWRGIPVNLLVTYVIEWGNWDSLWDRKGINSMEYAKDYLFRTDRHVKTMMKVLKARGFNCKVL